MHHGLGKSQTNLRVKKTSLLRYRRRNPNYVAMSNGVSLDPGTSAVMEFDQFRLDHKGFYSGGARFIDYEIFVLFNELFPL